MREIIRKLQENRDILSTEVFNIKSHSSESYDLLDTISNRVVDAIRKYGDDIDLDDTGLDANPEISDNRVLAYRAKIYRYDKENHEELPLTSKEIEGITAELESTILLPKEDDEYEYRVEIEYSANELAVHLHREKKAGW